MRPDASSGPSTSPFAGTRHVSPSELFAEIVKVSPSFDAVVAEHTADHGTLLPHLLMGDLVRYVGAHFVPAAQQTVAPSSRGEVAAILKVLDAGLASTDLDTQNVIAVSFVEDIESHEFYKPLARLFGLRLRSEHKRQLACRAR